MAKARTSAKSRVKATTAKGTKSKGSAAVARPARSKTPRGAPGQQAVAESLLEGYTIAAAVKRLGPPDPALEAAVRAGHPDAYLQGEGASVATDRILEDGQRLLSKALVHLESTDPDIRDAARRSGLTRPLLALTADALSRLASMNSQLGVEHGKRSERKQVTSLSLEGATNHGRVLKQQTLERLKLLARVDPALEASVSSAAARAETPEQLAMQLTSLAQIVAGLADHASPTVRALAATKSLDASDADELTAAVEAIGQASNAVTPGTTRREEKQAVLDVLDGLCLVLLDDLLRTLRGMARTTPKVRRPVLHGLATYFGARGKAEEEPEEPPAPAPV